MPSVKFPTSEVVIYETQGNGVILLVKKSSDQKYYLFLINSINGAITFDGIEGSSVFDTKLQALKTMQANYVLSMDKNPIIGQALIGAARYGPVLYILVVKQSSAIARIQNVHTIFSVTETEFYRINLHFHRSLTQQEQRRIDRIVEFPVAEYHMWCETKDLTVPLYSDQHDPSFLWNKHWTKSFEDLGQKDVCINLLQGTAVSQLIFFKPSLKADSSQHIQIFEPSTSNEQSSASSIKSSKSAPSLIKKSSDLNEYTAETTSPQQNKDGSVSLSSASSAANISTQSIQSNSQSNNQIPLSQSSTSNKDGMFYRFTIISIRESVNGGTRYYARGIDDEYHPANEVQVHIIVESNDGKLWSHVWRRGSVPVRWSTVIAKNLPTVSISIHPEAGKDTHFYFDYLKSLFPENIQIINLLHNSPSNSEFPLCVAYQNAVERIPNVQYYEFDWHKEVKEKGVSGAVKLLYCYLQNPEFTYSETETNIPITLNLENIQSDPQWDTTYVDNPTPSIFFPNEISSPNSKTKLNLAENEKVVLPEFGKSFSRIQKAAARINCMDSLDRTNVVSFFYATRVVSKILEEIGICKTVSTFEEVMNLPNSVRNFLCDAFLGIGDCVSYLYTNTPACMTEIFHEVAQDDIKTKSDSSIAVKRRYHNFLTDRKRQKAYNMFLGKCFDIHIPNIDCSPLPPCVSMGSAQFMQPYINDGKTIIDPTNLLQISSYTINTVGCKAIIMMLSELCYVTDIYMIVSPPNPPSSVSISSSLTFGMKTPLVEKVAFPIVTKPQPIHIKIPPDRNNYELNLMRFLIFEFDCRNLDSKGKCYQSDMMTISNIFVFGQQVLNPNNIKKFYNFTYQQFPAFEKKRKPRPPISSYSNISINFSDFSNSSNANISTSNSNENATNSSNQAIMPSRSRTLLTSSQETTNTEATTASSIRSSANVPQTNKLNSCPSANIPLISSNSSVSYDIFEPPEEYLVVEQATPDAFLRKLNNNTPMDFLTTIRYEDCRINFHIGRLQSLKIAVKNGFNPLDINIGKHFRNVPQMDLSESPCSVCGSVSSWKCFLCQKSFCKNKECTKQNFFNDSFYFNQPSVVCDKCAITFRNYRMEVKNLLNGYKSFMALENSKEGEVNKFVTNFIKSQKQKKIENLKQELFQNRSMNTGYISELSFEQRKQQIINQTVEKDPSKFPSAFFIDTQNPSLNLLLTDEGFSITSAEWGNKFTCFSLGCKMNVSSIFIKGSDDCLLQITESEGKSQMVELKANQENECSNLCGRLFSVNLISGTLNSIYIKGVEMQRTLNRQKINQQNTAVLPKLKFMKAKNIPLNNANKIVSTDIGKDKDITGVLLQNFAGAYSILIEVFKNHGNSAVKVIKRYLPRTDEGNDFLVLFKKPVRGARVDVQIVDYSYNRDPKIMII